MITREGLNLGWVTICVQDISKIDGVVEAQHTLVKLRQGQVQDVLQVLHGSTSPPLEGAVTRLDGLDVPFVEYEQQWLQPTSLDMDSAKKMLPHPQRIGHGP